jgi:hypothetical protein
MLPFLGRSFRPKRARSHRNTVSSQRVNMGLCLRQLVGKRGDVQFLGEPDAMEQDGQLPCVWETEMPGGSPSLRYGAATSSSKTRVGGRRF